MFRFVSLIAVAAAVTVALLVPGAASADAYGCPPTFDPYVVSPGGGGDRNADGLVCRKVAATVRGITIDNNVPDTTAAGVTDVGSSVLVDTETGETVAGSGLAAS